MEPMPIVTNLV